MNASNFVATQPINKIYLFSLLQNLLLFSLIRIFATENSSETLTIKQRYKMKKFLFAVMFALAAFNSSYAQVTNEKKSMEENMKEVQAYLKECGAFFIATVDGDQPRVRPFGVSEIIDGRLYIMTGKVKDVYKQIAKNGKFEICALKKSGAEWLRLSGTLVNTETLAVKEEFLNRNPSLKSMYKADDDNMAVLQITDATARFCSFAAQERKVNF